MDYPRFIRSGQLVKARRTSGDVTLNSTAWANVDTSLDLTLNECQVGDEIIFGVSGLSANEATGVNMDVVTVVSAAAVSSFGARGAATAAISSGTIPALYAPTGVYAALSGVTPPYTVVAGDLVDGSVTLRLRYATDAATNKVLFGSVQVPLDVWAMNLGPAQ